METESQLEKSSRKFLQLKFSNWLCCSDSCALSKLNWKHQKSIADIKSQISNAILRINSYYYLFLLLISRKRKRNATFRYWTFSSKGNVHKSSFGLFSRAPGPIKGSGAQKQRPHKLLLMFWSDKKNQKVYLLVTTAKLFRNNGKHFG